MNIWVNVSSVDKKINLLSRGGKFVINKQQFHILYTHINYDNEFKIVRIMMKEK